jgi:hypothetical protein
MLPVDSGSPAVLKSPRRRPDLTGVVVLLVALATGGVEWYAYRAGALHRAQLAAAQHDWQQLIEQEPAERQPRVESALAAVDAYFDETALPAVKSFLEDFTGPIDSTTFAYKWAADKLGFRGSSTRVNDQVKASLAEHLKFPDELARSIGASLERFETLETQADADLRDRAYDLLHGAGVSVDKAELARMLTQASTAARRATIEKVGHDTASSLGGLAAGKEVALVVLQAFVLERVVLAVATRTGIVTAGGTVAAGTAAAGTATGPGAPVGYALAAAELTIAVGVDLLVSHWLEAQAETSMQEQLEVVRAELKKELRAWFTDYGKQLDDRRAKLLVDLARP